MGTIERRNGKKAMTDTKMFTTTAITKQGAVKVFIGFNHHRRAVIWLRAH
jgi:hypothetical protein